MSILASVLDSATELLGKFIPDKDKAAQLAHDLATMADKHHSAAMMAQLEVNKAEAAHKSLFVAGWRPFIGWVCGVSMAFNFIGVPIGVALGLTLVPLELTVMMPVLMGMLGLGGLRTFEKVKKVSREK